MERKTIKMTEKEKMISGKPYNAMDPELVEDRQKAKKLCNKINNTDEYKEKIALIQKLFNTSNLCYVEPFFFCDYGYNIIVGNNFYANHNCVILDVNKVIIGENVKFGPCVQVYTATHPLDYKKRMQGVEMAYPIEIGNNVWIGGGTIICPGVKIGENSVIGAGSVVTKDILNNVLAVGNPCKVIKKI